MTLILGILAGVITIGLSFVAWQSEKSLRATITETDESLRNAIVEGDESLRKALFETDQSLRATIAEGDASIRSAMATRSELAEVKSDVEDVKTGMEAGFAAIAERLDNLQAPPSGAAERRPPGAQPSAGVDPVAGGAEPQPSAGAASAPGGAGSQPSGRGGSGDVPVAARPPGD